MSLKTVKIIHSYTNLLKKKNGFKFNQNTPNLKTSQSSHYAANYTVYKRLEAKTIMPKLTFSDGYTRIF